jgi:hypothetical protein
MHVHALACNTMPVKDGHLQLGNQTLLLLLQLGPFFTRRTVRTEVHKKRFALARSRHNLSWAYGACTALMLWHHSPNPTAPAV